MTLEGKKKYTAALIAIIGTIVIQFAPEQKDAIMQVAATLAPLLVGGVYILAQGQHDKKKEEVKIETEKSFQAERSLMVAEESIHIPDAAVMIDEWDLPEFSELDRRASVKAEANYFESNPMTNFFAAPQVLKNIKCVSLDQALAAWGWYEDKARDAFKEKFGFPYSEAKEHLADDKTCPYYSVDNMARQKGIHHWAMLRKLRDVRESLGELEELEDLDIAWGDSLAPRDRNLFTVGQYAKYVVKDYYKKE